MKIGAGGLQNLAAQELIARQGDPASRTKPTPDPLAMQAQEIAKNLLNRDLNKAVEQLNKLAHLFNQTLEFKLVRDAKPPKIKVTNKKTGQVEEWTPEEALALLTQEEQPEKKNRGQHLDSYA